MILKDANVLKNKMCEHCSAPFIHNCTIEECRDMLCSAMDAIDDTPIVDAVPVVHGYWKQISADEMFGSGSYELAAYACSCCGFDIELDDEYNFYPKCGAKMNEVHK